MSTETDRTKGSIWSSAGALLALQKATPPITHIEADSAPPLSLAQERLWLLEKSEADVATHCVSVAWDIYGDLDIGALERSLEHLVQRHEALRTSYPDSGTGPVQLVGEWHLRLPVLDFSKETTERSRAVALDKARRLARQPFTLASGPLFRAALYRYGAAAHLLVLVVHQINFDGSSMRIICRELAECYRAFAGGAEPTLAPLPVRYTDFAWWQRKILEGDLLAEAFGFWRRQFLKPYQPLHLPADHPRSRQGSSPGTQLRVCLPKPLVEQLKSLSHAENTTLFAALLASLDAWLHRETRQEDILILVTTANRLQPELRHLVGLVANVLPMRFDVSGSPSFRQLVRRAGQVVSGCLAHQMLPLSHILDFLNGAPGLKEIPMLQVLMLYNSAPLPTLQMGAVTFTPSQDLDNGTAKLDLTFDLADTPEGIQGHLKYRTDLFEPDTVRRFLRHWISLIEWGVAHADQPIDSLPIPVDGPGTILSPSTARRPLPLAQVPFPAGEQGRRVTVEGQPRSPLEGRLVRIWQAAFHGREVGIHDPFFSLGGHSLIAVKLLADIENETGIKLRISAIYQYTTIARLAQAMTRDEQLSVRSSLVEIQPHGTRAPLFLVHGVGGGMFWGYSNLARHLGRDQPVYGFRSQGLDGHEEFARIEDMAAHYVADLLEAHPRGPYRLGGYCFGGNVAYEMARQLLNQGRKVDLLLLMNCWPNHSSYTHPRWSLELALKALWNFSLRFQHQIRCVARRPAEFLKWRAAWLETRVRTMLREESKESSEMEHPFDLPGRSEEHDRLWRDHVRAWRKYRPEPYPERLVLFRTRGHPLFCSFDHAMGWGEYAAGGVEVRICPGDHESILEEKNVPHTASQLKALLEELDLTSSLEPIPRHVLRL